MQLVFDRQNVVNSAPTQHTRQAAKTKTSLHNLKHASVGRTGRSYDSREEDEPGNTVSPEVDSEVPTRIACLNSSLLPIMPPVNVKCGSFSFSPICFAKFLFAIGDSTVVVLKLRLSASSTNDVTYKEDHINTHFCGEQCCLSLMLCSVKLHAQ